MIDTPTTPCPNCGSPLEMHAPSTGGEGSPVSGDVTICLYCAAVLVFDEDLKPRMPTAEERSALIEIDEVRRVVSAVKRHGPRDPGRWKEKLDD